MKVLVAGWIGSTNLGDELVFAGLRRVLAAHDVEVAAISRDPAATERLHGVGAIPTSSPSRIFAAIGRADAVVFGGGGLLQDTTSLLNLPYHQSRPFMAWLRGTPFAGVGLGVGGLDTRIGRWQVGVCMRRAVATAVRDQASVDLLAACGVPGAVSASDLAFALAEPDGPPPTTEGTLAVCLRPWGGGRTRLPAEVRGDATPQEYVDRLAAGLDAVVASTGLAVRFVALQHDRDDAFHARVADAMQAPATRCAPDMQGVLDEVAAAQAVISMRYHGGIAAVLAGRPVVLIDYAAKVASLAAELGDGARLLAWRPDDLDRLPAALEHVLGQAESVRAGRTRLIARQRGNDDVVRMLLDAV